MITDRLANAAEVGRQYQHGDYIVREGEPGREMFIIKSGAVIIRRQAGGEIGRLHKGEFFGEMSVLESMPRDADVVADGETRVLVLGPGALLVRLRRDPSFALELLQTLSGRVRRLNERLA